MTKTLHSGKSPMSIVSSFRRECSDQAGSDIKVSGWPDGIGHGGAEPLNICCDHTIRNLIGEGWRSAEAAYAIVVLDKRSADPGPITIGLGLAKIRGYRPRAATSLWGNGSWLSPGRRWGRAFTPPPTPAHWRGPRLR